MTVAAERLANNGQPITPQAPLTPVAVEVIAPVKAKSETPAQPLPEAPASANCYVHIGQHRVQITLRDADESRLLERLSKILSAYQPA